MSASCAGEWEDHRRALSQWDLSERGTASFEAARAAKEASAKQAQAQLGALLAQTRKGTGRRGDQRGPVEGSRS